MGTYHNNNRQIIWSNYFRELSCGFAIPLGSIN